MKTNSHQNLCNKQAIILAKFENRNENFSDFGKMNTRLGNYIC